MIGLNGKVRIFLYAGTCDMRRQIAGLVTMVREELGRDPQCGDLYVFRGRRGDQIKILFSPGAASAGAPTGSSIWLRWQPCQSSRLTAAATCRCWRTWAPTPHATSTRPATPVSPRSLRTARCHAGSPCVSARACRYRNSAAGTSAMATAAPAATSCRSRPIGECRVARSKTAACPERRLTRSSRRGGCAKQTLTSSGLGWTTTAARTSSWGAGDSGSSWGRASGSRWTGSSGGSAWKRRGGRGGRGGGTCRRDGAASRLRGTAVYPAHRQPSAVVMMPSFLKGLFDTDFTLLVLPDL